MAQQEGPVSGGPTSPRHSARSLSRTPHSRTRTPHATLPATFPQTLAASGGGTPARARGGCNGVRWGGGRIWLGRLLGFMLLISFLAALCILNTHP